jgi:hypothetical protein
MNPSLTSTLSEFSRKSDFSTSPLATEPSNKPPPPQTIRNLITWPRLDRLVAFAFPRSLMMFLMGVVAALVWQSYGGMARMAMANWSPHLAWLAPAPTPPASSAERFKATSLALAALRQSVDKLATEIGKLEAQGLPDGTVASPSSRQGPRRR